MSRLLFNLPFFLRLALVRTTTPESGAWAPKVATGPRKWRLGPVCVQHWSDILVEVKVPESTYPTVTDSLMFGLSLRSPKVTTPRGTVRVLHSFTLVHRRLLAPSVAASTSIGTSAREPCGVGAPVPSPGDQSPTPPKGRGPRSFQGLPPYAVQDRGSEVGTRDGRERKFLTKCHSLRVKTGVCM